MSATPSRPAWRAFRAGALCALLLSLPVSGARAITAGDARTQSFKLQSEGMRLYHEGKYREAIDVLQKVVNIHLNSFMAWFYLGASLSAERRYSDAVEPLKIALDLQPDYVQAHLALGDVYLKLGETDEARASYLRALNLQPNYAAGHDGMGRLFESLGQDDEAEASYRKALEINVAFADAYTHLGELYLRKSRLDDAVALFLKAIQVRPDFSQAYTRLGVALSLQERFDDAMAAARRSFELAPLDPEPRVALGRIELEMQSLRRARQAVDEALVIDPEFVYAHLLLADLERAGGSPDRAVAVLEARLQRPIDDPRLKRVLIQALKRDRTEAARMIGLHADMVEAPGDPAPMAALARFLAGMQAHALAADMLQQAAGMTGGAAPVVDGATVAARGTDEATAAVRGTDAAADPAQAQPAPDASPAPATAGPAAPARAPLMYEAGTEYILARRWPEAMAIFETLAADPAGGALAHDALFNLGVARAGAGLDDAAAQTFRDCVAADPGDAQAHLYLGNALLRLGRKDEARTAYDAYLARAAAGPETERVRRLVEGLGGAAATAPAPAAVAPASAPSAQAPTGTPGSRPPEGGAPAGGGAGDGAP